MKSLLAVESLEPRALLAGLCGLPTTMLQAPVESLPPPAAEVAPMRGGVHGSQQAPLGHSIEADFAPPTVANPNSPPLVNLPSDSGDVTPEQTQPPGLANPPVESDKTTPTVEGGSADLDPWKNPELENDPSNNTPKDSLSPGCSADPEPVPKSDATLAPFADSPARVGSPTAPPFVSLFVTSSPTPQVNQLMPSSGERGDSTEEPSAFHYFEPISTNRLDADGVDSEPLANLAVRETFVAFWLMTKQDLDDLEGQNGTIDSAASTTHAVSSEPIAAGQQVEKSMTAVSRQTDIVQKALAAISSADDVIRQADAACASTFNRTTESTTSIAEAAIAQALACSATKANQAASTPADASQPGSPRWQLGMCSLVSILFSFRAPNRSSDKTTAIRKRLIRVIHRAQ